jgi:hypothetical protein
MRRMGLLILKLKLAKELHRKSFFVDNPCATSERIVVQSRKLRRRL